MSPPRLHPDYEFLDLLGEGSFGWVWRTKWRGVQERAVKVFKPGRVNTDQVSRELEKLQHVREHPGVVAVYDFDLACDQPYYAMSLHAERQRSRGRRRAQRHGVLCQSGTVAQRAQGRHAALRVGRV